MVVPSTSDILRVWDAGSLQDHPGRALVMLSLDNGASAPADVGKLGIGARDGMLIDLRSRIFGSRVETVSRCDACGVELSVAFDIQDIRVSSPPLIDDRLDVRCDGYDILARLPTTDDLLAIRYCRDTGEARERLLGRCVIEIDGRGAGMRVVDLPASVQAEIERVLGEADPQANVDLLLQCAACGREHEVCFDIVRYFWAEIEQYGLHTLRDVHELGRAYGWTEQDTLALSPQRRRRYLEMVSDG